MSRATKTKSKKVKRAFAASKPNARRENERVKSQNKTWIPYFLGNDNIYPNDLALRYRRSNTHSAIINSKVNYSVGNEILFFRGNNQIEADGKLSEVFDEINTEGDDLKSFLKECLFQWILFGNLFIEVIRKDSRPFLFVKDTSMVRLGRDGESVYISSFWRDIKNQETPSKDHPVKKLPLWNESDSQSRFVIHLKRKSPEYNHYGIPDYHSILKDADIEYKIKTYNLTRFENGFFPSAMITMFGEPPEGMTAQEWVNSVINTYTGEGRNSKVLASLVDDPDMKPEVHEFSGVKEGEFTELDNLTSKAVIRGHRWFPNLAGIETSGKLGGNQEIIRQWNIVMNNVVNPDYQTPVINFVNRIFSILSIDVSIKIVNRPPVGLNDQIEPSKVLTINEQRNEIGKQEATDGQLEEIKENGRNNKNDDSK